jgi:hypothetical protein
VRSCIGEQVAGQNQPDSADVYIYGVRERGACASVWGGAVGVSSLVCRAVWQERAD